MTVSSCTHCGAELRSQDAKFCNQCGRPIEIPGKTSSGPSQFDKIKTQLSSPDLQRLGIPVLGGIGIVILGFALLQILELISLDIRPDLILISGWVVSFALLSLALIVQFRNYLEQGPLLLLHLTGLVVLTATQYIADVLQRSVETRISLLVVAGVLVLESFLISTTIETSSFQEFSKILAMYIGWLLIIYVSGSNYIERWVYTVILTSIILITNYGIVNFDSLAGKSAYTIVEFIALLQTSVINSSLIAIISFVTVLSFPLFMYLAKTKLIESQNIELRVLLVMVFFPQLSIIIAITSGALVSPFPHLLFVSFAIGWSLFLQDLAKTEGEYLSIISQIGLSFSAIFLIGTLIYSFSSTGLDFIILLLGTIGVTTLFSSRVSQRSSSGIQGLNILFINFGIFQLVQLNNYDLFVPIMVFLVGITINFAYQLIQRQFNFFHLAAIQLSTGLFVLAVSIVEYFGILVPLLFYLTNFVFYFYLRSNNPDFSYPLAVINYVVPSLVLSKYLTEFSGFFWILTLVLVIFVGIFLFDDTIIQEERIIEFSLLALPLVLAYNFSQDHLILNAIAGLGLAMFVISYLPDPKDLSSKLIPFLLLLAFSLGRMTVSGEESVILEYDVWALSNLIIAVTIGVFLLFGLTFGKWDFSKFAAMLGVYTFIVIIFLLIVIKSQLPIIESLLIYTTQMIITGTAVAFLIKPHDLDDPLNRLMIPALSIVVWIISLIGNAVPFFYLGLFLQFGIIVWFSYKISFDSNVFWLETFVMVIYLVSLFFINEITLFTSLLLMSYILFLSPHTDFLDQQTSMRSRSLYRLIGLAFLTVFPFILVLIDQIPLWSGLLVWSLSAVFSIVSYQFSSHELQKYSIFVGVLYTLGLILWTSVEFAQVFLLIGAVPLIGYVLMDNRRDLLQSTTTRITPVFSEFSLSLTIILLGYLVVVMRYLQAATQLSLVNMSRFLALISLALLVITIVFNNVAQKNVVSDGILITSFLSMLISSLFGFFDTPISNLLVGLFSLGLLIGGLITRDRYIISLAVAMYLLSVLKAILDTIYLDPLGTALSWLSVGIQTIFLAIFGSRLYNSLLQGENISQ